MGSLALLLAGGIILALVFSELASNTAAVNLIVPIILGITSASDGNAVPAVVGVTLAASLGFMLPVATPPNAMVYGSQLVKSRDMLRVGLVLNVAGAMTIWVVVMTVGSMVLP